jgi:hypothetical protein
MLVSPIRVHNLLAGLLDEDGPHTALLITPPGQLIAQASLDDEGSEPNGTNATDASEADTGEREDSGSEGGSEDGSEEGSEEDDDDEPYLEGPERLRLLLGLASQWEDDESPRVECEVSAAL